MSTGVDGDYKVMLDVADKYSKEAKFIDEIIVEFSATSDELLNSIHNILSAIEGVSEAANEGASSTTDIAYRVSEVNTKSNEVIEQISRTKESTTKLTEEISKFKI